MTGLIPPGPLAYEGQLVVSYVSRREDPTTSFINFNVPTIWINTANGNIWILVGKALGIANWVLLGTGSSGPAIKFGVPAGSSPVLADGTGLVTFTSTSGTIAITGSSHTINFDLVGGGVAIETFLVQAASAPGLTTVTPSSGQVTINGSVVAAHSVPVETRSRALHAYNVETQVASAVAATPANTNNVGLACFNNSQFTVDATSGMVSLVETPPTSCFVTYKSANTSNATGDGTVVTVVFDTVTEDLGSNYNNSTGVFTAPTTGTYMFVANCGYNNIGAGHTLSNLEIVASGVTIQGPNFNAANVADTGGGLIYSMSAIVKMTAGDTAFVQTVFSGSTKTVNILGFANSSTNLTFFSGYLLTGI